MREFPLVPVIIFILVVIAASTVVFFFSKPKSNSRNCQAVVGEVTVTIHDDGYSPDTITIKQCTKVTFKNASRDPRWPASNIHPTHGIYPEFDPKEPVDPGKEWSFVFERTGNWKYHDHLFPSIRGVIDVSAN